MNSSPDLRELRTEKSRPLLVIEVSDSSLRFDRDQKAQLYAKGSVPEYWIVSLVNDVLEVFRDPQDGAYQTNLVLKPTETISPLSFSNLDIEVSGLIP